jgi:hypothetical protein
MQLLPKGALLKKSGKDNHRKTVNFAAMCIWFESGKLFPRCFFLGYDNNAFHGISPKWHVTEKNDKDKRCAWRGNPGKIINFPAMCIGLSPSQLIFTLILCKKGSGIMAILGW